MKKPNTNVPEDLEERDTGFEIFIWEINYK